MISFYVSKKFHHSSFLTFLEHFHLSKKHIFWILSTKRASMDSVPCEAKTILFEGKTIDFDLNDDETTPFIPTYGRLQILYEDQDVLVINKPAGKIIYPDDPLKTGTIVNDVLGYYQRLQLLGPVRYLHRLDKETTGCFMIAKHLLAHSKLTNEWDHQTTKRTYLAVTEGRIILDAGIIEEPIGKDRHRQNSYLVLPNGLQAKTTYTVLKRKHKFTLVAFQLHTGRTHQIRVHSAHIGHPILGDQQYGSKYESPLCLHSWKIAFISPSTDELIEITAPTHPSISQLFPQ